MVEVDGTLPRAIQMLLAKSVSVVYILYIRVQKAQSATRFLCVFYLAEERLSTI